MVQPDQPSKKPLVYYCAIVTIVMMLLNALVFPAVLQRQVKEVGYSDFLKMVDAGEVVEVELEQDSEQIIFVAKNDKGEEYICKTGTFPDDLYHRQPDGKDPAEIRCDQKEFVRRGLQQADRL